MRIALAALLLLALARPSAAHGPDVYPEQYELLAGPGNQRLVLATTYGLVLSVDGGATWRWVCETAFGVTDSWAPEYEVTGNGVITATSLGGLRVSADGCTWVPAGGLAGAQTAASSARDRDGGLWLVSMGEGGTATVRRSTDDAASWTDVATLDGLVFVTRLAIAPSDPTRLYVSTDDVLPDDPFHVAGLRRSSDGGATWTRLPTTAFTINRPSAFHLAAIDPGDPDRVYVRATKTSDTAEERLYRTVDGGATWTEVFRIDDSISGVAVRADGTVLVGTPGRGMWRSTDGGATFAAVAGQRFKVTCVTELDDGALYQCADSLGPDGMGLGRSTDATTWTTVMTMRGLAGPLACPVGTLQRDECAGGSWCFYKIKYGLAGDDTTCAVGDAGPPMPTPEDDCGCGAAGGPSSALFAGLLALWLWRRPR